MSEQGDLVITYKLEPIARGFYNLTLTCHLRDDFLKRFDGEDGIVFLSEYLSAHWGYNYGTISYEYRSIHIGNAYIVKGFNDTELTESIQPIINFFNCQLSLAIECKQVISQSVLPKRFEFSLGGKTND